MLSFHAIRHTCATSMLLKGVPPTVVAAHLGHSDVNITLRIYGHALPSAQKDPAQVRSQTLQRGLEVNLKRADRRGSMGYRGHRRARRIGEIVEQVGTTGLSRPSSAT